MGGHRTKQRGGRQAIVSLYCNGPLEVSMCSDSLAMWTSGDSMMSSKPTCEVVEFAEETDDIEIKDCVKDPHREVSVRNTNMWMSSTAPSNRIGEDSQGEEDHHQEAMMKTLQDLVGLISGSVDKKVKNAVDAHLDQPKEPPHSVPAPDSTEMTYSATTSSTDMQEMVNNCCEELLRKRLPTMVAQQTVHLHEQMSRQSCELAACRAELRELRSSMVIARGEMVQMQQAGSQTALQGAWAAQARAQARAEPQGALECVLALARATEEMTNKLGDQVKDVAKEMEAQGRRYEMFGDAIKAAESTATRRIARLEQQVEQHTSEMRTLQERCTAVQEHIDAADHRMSAGMSGVAAQAKKEREATAEVQHSLDERLTLCESAQCSDREATAQQLREMQGSVDKYKQLILKTLRTDQQAETLLKEYAGNIASQVSAVMNQAITVRIQENNALIDTALRQRLPEYARNADSSFALVHSTATRGFDDEAIRRAIASKSKPQKGRH